jgi:hypothetical protein
MPKLSKEEIQKYYQIFSNSIETFAKFFLPHYLTSAIPDFHREIYKLLPNNPRIVLASPRGFAKSTIVSIIYPLWLALFKKRMDICIISASEGLAVDWLRKIKRELDTNPKILAFFGDLRSTKWSESHIITKDGVNIRARGAGGQIRGFRPDVVICDDMETDEGVRSEEQRRLLKEWLFKACLNTLIPEGQFIVIGTIIHPLSVLADLLSIENNWTKKKYQAYRDGLQESGKELWVELWNHERLQQRKKEIGSWAFSSEFMNDPVSDETAPVKENQIRYWKELPTQYSVVITVDPAYSEDETADYKVASVVAIDQQLNRYLITYIRTHKQIGDFQNSIINLYLQYKGCITGLGVPNSGVEKGFFESFLRKCEERKIYPPMVELKNVFTSTVTQVSTRNKKARVVATLQPLFEAGKYYIHSSHIEAREEILSIGVSKWDDIVDTMAYAEQVLTPIFMDNTPKEQQRVNIEVKRKRMVDYGIG